jgi:hypothetical protein
MGVAELKAIVSGRALAAMAVFGAAMVPAMAVCAAHGAGTLSFETAGSPARPAAIISRWGYPGRTAARWQLVLDVGFIVSYAALMAVACLRRGRRLSTTGARRAARLAVVFAALGIAAGLCDMTQNVALWRELDGHTGQPGPAIARLALFGIDACVLAVVCYLGATSALLRRTKAAA